MTPLAEWRNSLNPVCFCFSHPYGHGRRASKIQTYLRSGTFPTSWAPPHHPPTQYLPSFRNSLRSLGRATDLVGRFCAVCGLPPRGPHIHEMAHPRLVSACFIAFMALLGLSRDGRKERNHKKIQIWAQKIPNSSKNAKFGPKITKI